MAIPLLGAIPGLLGAIPGLLGGAGGGIMSALGGAGGALGSLGGVLGPAMGALGKVAGPLTSMLGQAVPGALSGLSSKMGTSKEKKPEALLTPEQKSQMSASQALIPFYLQMLSGQMPDYLKRYLAQTQGALSQQARSSISDYLRKVGGAGMDFGPQQAAGLQGIYEGITPALTQGLTQSRIGLTGNAMQGLQQWSTQPVPWQKKPPEQQPSYGQAAGAGGLESLGTALGALKTNDGKSTQQPLGLGSGTNLGAPKGQMQLPPGMLKQILGGGNMSMFNR